jgi:predicted acyl esterase
MSTICIDQNVMMPLRDGVRLATDVYRLEGAPPAPVLQRARPIIKRTRCTVGRAPSTSCAPSRLATSS